MYERDHEDRAILCALRAPVGAVRDLRRAFVVDAAPGTEAWASVLAQVAPKAAGIALDIPESEEWPVDIRAAAATLRLRAGIPAPVAVDYTTVRTLSVDDEVWGAFARVADRAYDATVLRSLSGWDPILELADEGATVVVTLTPDEWTSMTGDIGVERVRSVTRRRWRLRRSCRPGRRPEG